MKYWRIYTILTILAALMTTPFSAVTANAASKVTLKAKTTAAVSKIKEKPAVKVKAKAKPKIKKQTKIRYKQGLIINAPLINPKNPPGGAQ